MSDAPIRILKVTLTNGATTDTIKSYLPSNYRVIAGYPGSVIVAGKDHAGWTLESYVIPRLLSGLHPSEELTPNKEK